MIVGLSSLRSASRDDRIRTAIEAETPFALAQASRKLGVSPERLAELIEQDDEASHAAMADAFNQLLPKPIRDQVFAAGMEKLVEQELDRRVAAGELIREDGPGGPIYLRSVGRPLGEGDADAG